MMMYFGEIPASVTVSSAVPPKQRGWDSWVWVLGFKEAGWVLSRDVGCEIYVLNCATGIHVRKNQEP